MDTIKVIKVVLSGICLGGLITLGVILVFVDETTTPVGAAMIGASVVPAMYFGIVIALFVSSHWHQ